MYPHLKDLGNCQNSVAINLWQSVTINLVHAHFVVFLFVMSWATGSRAKATLGVSFPKKKNPTLPTSLSHEEQLKGFLKIFAFSFSFHAS